MDRIDFTFAALDGRLVRVPKAAAGAKNVDVIWLRGKESLQRLGRGQSGEALGAKTICLVKGPVSPSLLSSPKPAARIQPGGSLAEFGRYWQLSR